MKNVILALGADIKNRFLLASNGRFSFGPDIGDLSQTQNFELFKKQVRRIIKKSKPGIIAYDLHPSYFSSLFAKQLSLLSTLYSLLPIQHHHAHIASVMQEYDLPGPAIGVSFDGTGYGLDGNSWGGEFLLVNKSKFMRLAHLRYRLMPGADRVVREPWRMVLSILGKKALPFLNTVGKKDKELILTMLAKNINSPQTSSAGRLFDAAAALLGICCYARYEAEGPIKLQALCDEQVEDRYDFAIVKENDCSIIDTGGLFFGILKDLKKGKGKRLIASKFHNSMAEIIVRTAKKLSKHLGIKDIALSGGVFQNNFLKKRVIKRLTSDFRVFTNTKTPVNDLNISLGQYYVSGYSSKS